MPSVLLRYGRGDEENPSEAAGVLVLILCRLQQKSKFSKGERE
jgi:hypothetical protein